MKFLSDLATMPAFWIGIFIVACVCIHFLVDAFNAPSEPPKKKGK